MKLQKVNLDFKKRKRTSVQLVISMNNFVFVIDLNHNGDAKRCMERRSNGNIRNWY